MKFYLDKWRSHIPESKWSKFQQKYWAEQGDQKIKVKNSKNSGLSWVYRCFWERERAGEEEISEGIKNSERRR
jgi:hypothetical protein